MVRGQPDDTPPFKLLSRGLNRPKGGNTPVALFAHPAQVDWMKKVARAGFLVLGAPNLISVAVVAVVFALMAPAVPQVKRPILLQAAEVASGFVTVFTSILLAELAGIEAGFCVFSVTVLWFFIHFIRLNRLAAFWRASSGVLLALLCDLVVSGLQ
jgi:hypothetical protein